MSNSIIYNPTKLAELGIEFHCHMCEEFLETHGRFKPGNMCPVCGKHIDEFGNHNPLKATKWIIDTFKSQGVNINEKHAETLFQLARIKSRNNEATYLHTIKVALEELKKGGRIG